MAGLGETLAGLAADRRGQPRPDGGRLEACQAFGANPGELAMTSYVPPGLAPGAPLVVVLHGCTQTAEGHAAAAGWLTLADRLGFAILAPQQQAGNNPNRCFNWFEPQDCTRGSGEAASIRAMVAHMVHRRQLDPCRVFVTGLSAGGAMAAVMLATYPEVFAAGSIVAGLPYGSAQSVQAALSAMRRGSGLPTSELVKLVSGAAPTPERYPRVCIWHGDGDRTVTPAAAAELARQWSGIHGLAAAPDAVEALRGRSRARWHSPDGEVRVEQHTVHGLGHGAPLSTRGSDALGFTAPFMLEAGVSSALVTARFWGLAPAEDRAEAEETGAGRPAAADFPEDQAILGSRALAATAPHVPPQVQAVIARALNAAGLLR